MLKWMFFLPFLFSLTGSGLARPYDQYKLTKWQDPLGRSPISFSSFQKDSPRRGRFTIGEVSLKKGFRFGKLSSAENGKVAILVNSALYPRVSSSLEIYIDDLLADGYSVLLDTLRGGEPSDLRDFLLDQWTTDSLVGALFIGDLPLAWYKIQDYWGDWEEFPIDYYFMDLDGNWGDSNGDGMFDSHTGSTEPEIWIGRLTGSHLTWGGEVELLRNYFTKDHQYRCGELSLPLRALAYDDDDWNYAGDAYLSLIYDTVTVVDEPLETTASGYRARLEQGYEFVHLMAHSSPWTHTFKPQGQGGTIYNYEINLMEPKAFFYNLFACSNTRWVETNNIACWYILSNPYGLVAVGTTKTGSMLYFEDFYGPLGDGQSIGEAFKSWLTEHGEDSPSWFYGLTILGDPTLRPKAGSGGWAQGDKGPQSVRDSSWSEYRITTNPFTDGNPTLTSDLEGNIYLVWTSGRDIRSNLYESHFTGGSWSSPQAVCPHKYWDLDPSMGSEPTGRVWIAWHSLRSDGVQNIFASYSDDHGTSWSEAVQLTDDPGYDVEPKLVIGPEGKPWVLFKSWRDGEANIYLCRYTTGWGSLEQVTTDPADDVSPSATKDGEGRVWVSWASNRGDNWDIYARYRSYKGFSPLYRVTSHPGADMLPSLVCDRSGQLWVFWESFRDGDANIYASLFDGEFWSSPLALTTDSSADLSPSTAPFGSTGVILTWRSNRGQHWSVYERHLLEGSWSPPVLLSLDGRDDISPVAISSPQGETWIAWSTNIESNWEICVSCHQPLGVAEGRSPPPPIQPSLSQNCPNPFNAFTLIRYTVPQVRGGRSKVKGGPNTYNLIPITLKVYNILGQEVRTLVARDEPPGSHQVLWDGKDDWGHDLPSSIYLCRLEVKARGQTVKRARKLVLLR